MSTSSSISWTDTIKPSLLFLLFFFFVVVVVVFSNFGRCISKGSHFQIIKRSQQLSLCRMVALKTSLFKVSGSVLLDYGVQHWTESRVSLNVGLGGVGDVASSSSFHEQTQSNRICCFQTSDAVFPKDHLFKLFWNNHWTSCWSETLIEFNGYYTDSRLRLLQISSTPFSILLVQFAVFYSSSGNDFHIGITLTVRSCLTRQCIFLYMYFCYRIKYCLNQVQWAVRP